MANTEHVDLVVIGAGVAGLVAARTYIELHPLSSVVVLDYESDIGGTWSTDRLYPGLKSNNLWGKYEYPDFPMTTEKYGVKPGEHVPGQVLHDYLNDFAKKYGILDKCRFKTKVHSAEKIDGQGWLLKYSAPGSESSILTEKLVVATGTITEPFIPKIPGWENFGEDKFHMKEFGKRADTLKKCKEVVILGGTKSAFDAAYAYAEAGVQAHMVIRESGHGPMWMAPPYVTPLKKWLENLVSTRFLTWMSPCIWGDADGYTGTRNFLHGTAFGRALVNTFWGILGSDVIALNKYDKHPETAKLKPWSQAMFIGAGLGILNYPTDFFEFVRNGQIKVHVSDIDTLSKNTVSLTNGEKIHADAFICSTGWKFRAPLEFLPKGSEAELGLPHYSKDIHEKIEEVDNEILTKFPRLKDQPVQNVKYTPAATDDPDAPSKLNQPYRLYRFMVPPKYIDDRSIAFVGVPTTIHTAIVAQVQALWVSAFFDGKLTPTGDVEHETLLFSRFGKWRYPAGHGDKYPDFVFDGVPYMDLLLGQLGLNVHRKGGGMAEAFDPYGPADWKGIIEEWSDLNIKN